MLRLIAFFYCRMQDRDYPIHMVLTQNVQIRFVLRLFVWLGFVLILGSKTAFSETPYPRIKPNAPNLSEHLTDSDARTFRSALQAVSRKSWPEVRSKRSALVDPVAKDVLYWLESVENPHADLSTLTYVSQNLSDWPRMTKIKAAGETILFDRYQGAQATLAWFQGNDPVSGEGRAALARAYYELGNDAEGDRWLRKAWREARLTRDRQKDLFGRYKNKLTAEDHYARADHLVWEGRYHYAKAQALMPFMDPGHKALIDSRIRVARNANGMDGAISRVPASMSNDPGLIYERARWRRRKRTKDYALPLMLQADTPPVSGKGKSVMWRERKILAYWAIQEKKFNEAYRLTLNHGATSGTVFAEAEFLAGWLALTKLNKPDQAISHFQRMRDGVSFPVSLSRAEYWLGRAYDAKQNPAATTHYNAAARFSNTYYGFLAGERLGTGGLVALPPEDKAAVLKTQFEADKRVRAMRLLAEAGEERYYTQFSFHLDDALPTLQELSLLSQMAKSYGYMKPSVRAAKQASRFQDMLTDSGYPMPDAIMNLPDHFNKPFVLAIARQESEFNNSAVSHARAYGLMQMINSTARATARKHRIPYSRGRLTTDIDYSAKLGAHHLNDLLREFDGSYILAAVGYNAGSHRAKQWIKTYGDPRTGQIDPIDWLESIPFSETRNYVQRVMENMQVYRARMNGDVAENRIYRDISVGAF